MVLLFAWKLEAQDRKIPPVTLSEQVFKNRKQFTFRNNFSFPQPKVMKPLQMIEQATWMQDLHRYLDSLKIKQMYLLTSNIKYIDVLLNWLISAVVRNNIPIQDILILSLDQKIHNILKGKKFCSIYVPPSSLFSPKYKFSKPFEMVMMLRLSLMRIINHFGFDVAMFDTDAIMLKDPKPLFDELHSEDIVGSLGTIPDDLFAEWKVTICIGVVIVKNSEKTGMRHTQNEGYKCSTNYTGG